MKTVLSATRLTRQSSFSYFIKLQTSYIEFFLTLLLIKNIMVSLFVRWKTFQVDRDHPRLMLLSHIITLAPCKGKPKQGYLHIIAPMLVVGIDIFSPLLCGFKAFILKVQTCVFRKESKINQHHRIIITFPSP